MALSLMAGAYCAVYFAICVLKYRAFAYTDFDLAVHAHTMWQLVHGSVFNSILGISFLGNHAHLILFFLTPLYAAAKHPLTLLLIQTLALGFSAVPLYKLAERLLGRRWALGTAALYLVYPATAGVNLFEFHPTALATFFLFCAAYYYESGRFRRFCASACAAMLCQENIPLAIAMFGVMAALERRGRRWVVVPLAGGSVYFFAAMALMRHFNAGTIDYSLLYSHLGGTPREMLRNLIVHPGLFTAQIFRPQVAAYLGFIFLPLACLPLLRPLKLLPAAPFILQHILSNRQAELLPGYHYAAEIIPFIFAAFAGALQYALEKPLVRNPRFLRSALGAAGCVSLLFIGPLPGIIRSLPAVYFRDGLDVRKEELLRRIPPGASVVSTFELLSHLTDRPEIFSLHHQYLGFYTLSRKPYRLPGGVSYAAVDFNDRLTFFFETGRGHINLREFWRDNAGETVFMADTLVLMKSGAAHGGELFSEIDGAALPAGPLAVIDGAVGLMAIDWACGEDPDTVQCDLYWKCLRPARGNIGIIVDVLDDTGRTVMRKARPVCYRMYPTNAWKQGQAIRERAVLDIPARYRTSRHLLRLSGFDLNSGVLYVTGTNGAQTYAAVIKEGLACAK